MLRAMVAVVWLAAAGQAALAQAVEEQAAQQSESTRPTLAVFDFEVGEDIGASGGAALAGVVRDEVQAARMFHLIDRQMMVERLGEIDLSVSDVGAQVANLVEYGRQLSAQKIIGGFVTSFGSAWVVTMRLVDVTTGVEEATVTREHQGRMEDLLLIARDGTRELLGLAPLAAPEASSVEAAVEAAATRPEYVRPAEVRPLAEQLRHGLPQELVIDLGGCALRAVQIPPGEFRMGSALDPEAVAQRYGGNPQWHADERPVRRVRISTPFYLGRFEVTQRQWAAVMGSNPAAFRDELRPVENVSWMEVREFCKRLTQRLADTGVSVRLPTEAEWEYACRAGSNTAYFFGDNDAALGAYAWYNLNADKQTHPIGQRRPNAFGLFDMAGNVWEYCSDWYGPYEAGTDADPKGPSHGEARVLRGGSWKYHRSNCRSSDRNRCSPNEGADDVGFRVVVEVPAPREREVERTPLIRRQK